MEKDFETFWSENRKRLLESNEEYRKVSSGYKMSSGADWLLFAMPIVAAILILNSSPFNNEILNWIVSAIAAIVLFAVCVWIKSLISGVRPISEVEQEIKEQYKKRYENNDKLE